MKKLLALTSATALAICGLAGSTATAAPGHGTTPTNVVIGILDGPTKAKQDGVTLKTRGETKVRTFTLTYDVGGYSGWHRHPGIVVATVISGSVVQRIGCDQPRVWKAGQSFTEVAPHYIGNLYRTQTPGAVPAVLAITQIYPADAPATRDEVPAPHCR